MGQFDKFTSKNQSLQVNCTPIQVGGTILPVVKTVLSKQNTFLPVNFVTVNFVQVNGTVFLKKVGHPRPLFLYFCLFNTQLTVNKWSI